LAVNASQRRRGAFRGALRGAAKSLIFLRVCREQKISWAADGSARGADLN